MFTKILKRVLPIESQKSLQLENCQSQLDGIGAIYRFEAYLNVFKRKDAYSLIQTNFMPLIHFGASSLTYFDFGIFHRPDIFLCFCDAFSPCSNLESLIVPNFEKSDVFSELAQKIHLFTHLQHLSIDAKKSGKFKDFCEKSEKANSLKSIELSNPHLELQQKEITNLGHLMKKKSFNSISIHSKIE